VPRKVKRKLVDRLGKIRKAGSKNTKEGKLQVAAAYGGCCL
jgi:hypothetical protein